MGRKRMDEDTRRLERVTVLLDEREKGVLATHAHRLGVSQAGAIRLALAEVVKGFRPPEKK